MAIMPCRGSELPYLSIAFPLSGTIFLLLVVHLPCPGWPFIFCLSWPGHNPNPGPGPGPGPVLYCPGPGLDYAPSRYRSKTRCHSQSYSRIRSRFFHPAPFLPVPSCLAKSFWVHLNLPVSIFVCWHPPLLICLHLYLRWPVYPLSCRLVFPVHFPACLI